MIKKPKWLSIKLPIGKKYRKLRDILKKNKLNTICSSGNCPNIGKCWVKGIATFMILGNICTRSCKFCNVKTGKPKKDIDWNEPQKIANSIKIMKIKHVVITSVTRDDLEDMGSIIWQETIKYIRKINPNTTIETLIPDFRGKLFLIDPIISLKPEIISHNLETVRRLNKKVRVQAKYDRSIELLQYLKYNGQNFTKTGIMLGLGEKNEEIINTMKDIKNSSVDIITIGQYLQPSKKHLPVYNFILPKMFKKYKKIGFKMGFKHIESGPLVRSSYNAKKHLK